MTSLCRLVRVARHVGCQSLVAAFPSSSITCHRCLDLVVGPRCEGREGWACTMAPIRGICLLCIGCDFSSRKRARVGISQPASSLFYSHAAVSLRSAPPSLEWPTPRITMVEWCGMGRNFGRCRVALSDDPALIRSAVNTTVRQSYRHEAFLVPINEYGFHLPRPSALHEGFLTGSCTRSLPYAPSSVP